MASLIVLAGCAVQTDPVSKISRLTQANLDKKALFADQDPIIKPITLYEAMARALKFNLDRRIKVAEESLALNIVEVSSYKLLPRLLANAGYATRDKEDASVSRSISTQTTSLEASKSQDRDIWRLDSTLSWNMLDFGVSYFEARQNNDRAYVAGQRTRKAVQGLLQDVRYAYWRAVAAQAVRDKIGPVIERVDRALRNAYAVERENLQPVLETLQIQKTLLEIVRLLESLRDELQLANVELARLMNVDPSTTFELVVPAALEPPTDLVTTAVAKLEDLALASRPELYEADYQERISVDEVHKSMIRLFPGLELRASKQYSSNLFTINRNWIEAGASFSLNLIDLASGPSQLEFAQAQVDITKGQRLALSMAILAQVRLSHQQYVGLITRYDRSRKLREINQRIAEHLKKARGGRSASEIQEIRAESAAIASELDQYKTYALLQNSLGRVYASIGLDPFPNVLENDKLATLATAIKAKFENWKTKGIPALPRASRAAQSNPAAPEDGAAGEMQSANVAVRFLSWLESLFN